VRITVTAGPDAGHAVTLRPGRHLVGRSRGCALVLGDPAVEPHHALVTVGPDGAAGLTQLCARTPVLVDHHPHLGGTVRPGAVVEVGDSRLALGVAPAGRSSSGDRLAVLADVERECYLARARSPWVVELGRGQVLLDLPGGAVGTSLVEQAGAMPHELHDDLPVLANLAPRRRYVVAVRGHHAAQVVTALVDQLPARGASAREWVVVADPADHDGDGPVTLLVPLAGGDELPAGCEALLELGARWRATWTADLAAASVGPVRCHVAGRGPLVGEQVARPGAEFGGGVPGVPEPAHGERQAPAPDAAGEVVAQPGEHCDLFVESRSPGLGEVSPIGGGRRARVGQLGERGTDLAERQPDALGGADEAHPAQHVGVVLAVPGDGALGADQPLVFVEPEGRGGDARARRHLAD
jgi:hypothetical protein